MPAPAPSPGDTGATNGAQHAKTALEAVAAALDPRDHVITLVAVDGRAPHLFVSSRHAQLAEDIYADGRCYRWGWGEPVCAVDDPVTAARKISYVLRARPAPGHG